MSQRAASCCGEGGVVGFLFGVEAEVFEQQGLAGLEVGDELGGDFADAIGGEADVLVVGEDVVEQLAQADRRPGAGSSPATTLALGAAEVRAENHLGLAAQRVLDGGDGLADAGVVEDAGRSSLESGTLKSTRMSTRLPVRSRSRMESFGMSL